MVEVTQNLSADRPITSIKEDRLGFGFLADNLKTLVCQQMPAEGIVVGIEGKWGSGKSSILALLVERMNLDKAAPVVVKFEPWIVGNRDGMLPVLFSDLLAALDKVRELSGDAPRALRRSRRIGAALQAYGAKVGQGLQPLVKIGGALGVPGLSVAADIIEQGARALATPDFNKTVAELKAELTAELKYLPRRVVVTIDDLDRLEPIELIEVLRLVRAVADFPNVTYLLCYDPDVLATNISAVLSGVDGPSFLEKIVQSSFRVPEPEIFDLRRWLEEDCRRLYHTLTSSALPDDVSQRLGEVCSIEGEMLRTPRDVRRVLNALRLVWPVVSDKVDFADMVWLQLMRTLNLGLYSWIERYVATYMASLDGAQVGNSERDSFLKELKPHVTDDISLSCASLWRFRSVVPGIKPEFKIDDPKILFDSEGRDLEGSVRARRLASRHHFRYYFALSKPSNSIADSEIRGFLAAAVSRDQLESTFFHLAMQKLTGGRLKADALLRRLLLLGDDELTDSGVSHVLSALANCMDDIGRQDIRGELGVLWAWRTASTLFKKLFRRLNGDLRSATLNNCFGRGKAIGWLMCEVLREEIFTHGRYGDRRADQRTWLFSEQELDVSLGLILERYRTSERGQLLKTPDLLSLMYGWLQSGDEDGVMQWRNGQMKTDGGFLRLIDAIHDRASGSNPQPLRRQDIQKFFEIEKLIERLRSISQNRRATAKNRSSAARLLQVVSKAKDF